MPTPSRPFCMLLASRWLPTVAASMLLVFARQGAHAQPFEIDGRTETVPGTQATPWVLNQQLIVGSTGTGALSIQGGGSVVNRNPDNVSSDPGSGILGGSLFGVGSATVTGSGSSWQNLNGELRIGQSGRGTLLIDAGGLASTEGFFGVRIGVNALSEGQVTVRGIDPVIAGNRSSIQTPREMDVGFGGRGSLIIEAGADVRNRGGRIATNPNSFGDALVTGLGSTWTNIADLDVGLSGQGRLTIEAAGAVSNGAGHIATNANSIGDALVTGSSSTWTNRSTLTVGQSGAGSLTLNLGGQVSAPGACLLRRTPVPGACSLSERPKERRHPSWRAP